MKLGLHISTAGNLITAPARAHGMGAEAIQIFASNPRGWRETPYADAKCEAFRAACAQERIDPVWIHMIYLATFGSPDAAMTEKSIAAMRYTLATADRLGAAGVVTHLGSHKGAGFDAALPRLKSSLTESLEGSEKSLLVLENSAGGGGNLGGPLEELAAIIEAVKRHPRVAVCIDTAHAFAAGYDLAAAEGLDGFIEKFEQLIGLDRLAVLHLNDSKGALGSHVDRHENIGDGLLGSSVFAGIVNHPKLAGLSGILEVPGIADKGPDKENLDRLKALRAA